MRWEADPQDSKTLFMQNCVVVLMFLWAVATYQAIELIDQNQPHLQSSVDHLWIMPPYASPRLEASS